MTIRSRFWSWLSGEISLKAVKLFPLGGAHNLNNFEILQGLAELLIAIVEKLNLSKGRWGARE